jgi:hypothetical protein
MLKAAKCKKLLLWLEQTIKARGLEEIGAIAEEYIGETRYQQNAIENSEPSLLRLGHDGSKGGCVAVQSSEWGG